jgi:hypothetical protein
MLFAIAGVQSFAGSFHRSCILNGMCSIRLLPSQLSIDLMLGIDPHQSDKVDLSKQCGGHIDPDTLEPVVWLVSNGINHFDPKGYICPLGQTCQVSRAISTVMYFSLIEICVHSSPMTIQRL